MASKTSGLVERLAEIARAKPNSHHAPGCIWLALKSPKIGNG
jgi:hypothetical protein